MQRAKFWRTPAALAAFALGLAVAACSSPTNQRPEPANISLDVTGGAHNFDSAVFGYAPITPHTVTVTNTGGLPTGALTVALSETGAGDFELSAESIDSISAGGTGTFTVGPRHNLPVGTRTATVTVSGGEGAGIESQSFTVTFAVTAAPVEPTFGIRLSVTESHVFAGLQVGYDPVTPLPIRVDNIGNQPTGALVVGLSGDDDESFALSAISIDSIPVYGYAYFTVGPEDGLGVRTHAATVTVSGDASIEARSFGVSFTVTEGPPPPDLRIRLSETATHTFDSAQFGYAAIQPLTVRVYNDGNQQTGALAVGLSGDGSASFALSATYIASIAMGGFAYFTVGPNLGLAPETHTAMVTVSGDYVASQSFNVTFTVTPIPTFTVIFNTHGGTPVPPTQTVQEGQRATRPAQDPARASHTFVDWFTAETGGAAFDFANTLITADTTIHARWQPVSGAGDYGSGNFAINFAGFASPIPGDIAGPTLNLRDGATETIEITGLPAGASVDWFFQDDPDPIARGATLALTPTLHGDMIGEHAVTAKVIAGERLYSRIITFWVMP